MLKRHLQKLLLVSLIAMASICQAGNQKDEPLSNSVRAMMQKSISDLAAPKLMFASETEGRAWLDKMSQRLEKRLPDPVYREDFLRSVHYEATRAGLDPQLVLGLIQVESGFKKYAEIGRASCRERVYSSV